MRDSYRHPGRVCGLSSYAYQHWQVVLPRRPRLSWIRPALTRRDTAQIGHDLQSEDRLATRSSVALMALALATQLERGSCVEECVRTGSEVDLTRVVFNLRIP